MGTRNRSIALLSFKLLGVYACIRAVELFPKVVQYFYEQSTEGNMWIALQVFLAPVLLIVIGIILWIAAPNISRAIFKSSDLDESQKEASSVDFEVIAFSVFGLVVIVDSVTMFIRSIVGIFMFKAYSVSDRESLGVRNVYLVFTALKIAIGMWLLLGSRGIVRFVRTLRSD